MTDINTIERYAKLENERASLEDALTAVKAKLDELRDGVLAYMQAHGVDRLTSAGRTLHVRRELWAGRPDGVTAEDLASVLDALGMDEFHADAPKMQALSAWLRELDRDGREIPEALRGVLVANEVFKVGSRKAS